MGTIKQSYKRTTTIKYRKSKMSASPKKDRKGNLHCGNCGAYITKK